MPAHLPAQQHSPALLTSLLSVQDKPANLHDAGRLISKTQTPYKLIQQLIRDACQDEPTLPEPPLDHHHIEVGYHLHSNWPLAAELEGSWCCPSSRTQKVDIKEGWSLPIALQK